jgi:hypothetical protein
MYLIYFDETKFEKDNPYFFMGGILIKENLLEILEKEIASIQKNFFGTSLLKLETELHGKLIFQGKGHFRKRKLSERLKLFEEVTNLLINFKIPIILICLDVERYWKNPNQECNNYQKKGDEYKLGLQLILSNFEKFLENKKEIGLVFGDYEKDEITSAIENFSAFKEEKIPISGITLNRIKDTIYFTQSHHSRFLQIADLVLYMANRYENSKKEFSKWHDSKLMEIYATLKEKGDIKIFQYP